MSDGSRNGKPTSRARLRPIELVGGAAIIAVFVGLVVFMGTREWVAALEFAGLGFVASLVVVAMLLLATTPKDERPDPEQRDDEPRGH